MATNELYTACKYIWNKPRNKIYQKLNSNPMLILKKSPVQKYLMVQQMYIIAIVVKAPIDKVPTTVIHFDLPIDTQAKVSPFHLPWKRDCFR